MIYDGVRLKDPHRLLIRVLVSECDDFEDCDLTSMTSQSQSCDVIDDVTNRCAVGTFYSCRHTDTQTHIDTSTDYKGR